MRLKISKKFCSECPHGRNVFDNFILKKRRKKERKKERKNTDLAIENLRTRREYVTPRHQGQQNLIWYEIINNCIVLSPKLYIFF